MPDLMGRLSPAEIRAVHLWLYERHSGPYACPISGHTDMWSVSDYVLQSVIYPVGVAGATVSPSAWPVVQIACASCGYIMYFSAGVMGLYPAPTIPPRMGGG